MMSTAIYKDEGCKTSLGKPETVTYRLIDGEEVYKNRWALAKKAKANLHQVSGEAKAS